MQSSNIQLMREHYLLAALDEETFGRIAQASRVTTLAPQQILFQRGDPAYYFFLLSVGQIKLCVQSRDGREKIIELVTRGQTFAEAVMFFEVPAYPVAAIALEASTVIGIPNIEFLKVARSDAQTCLRLLGDLSRRLHAVVQELGELSLENATHRVARYLVDLARPIAGEATVALEESKQTLASRLSIKPETLSRTLRALADAGVLSVEGRTIRIPDLARLRHWA
jgi:CRP/FNR family transcriptional regulator, dissimilatory nitrate respiration regulator